MSFGDIFKHMSPLYDAATGFTGTAAQNAMMVLGGKAAGNMGGNSNGMMRGFGGNSSGTGGMMNMAQQQPETEEDRRLKVLIKALKEGGY